MLVFVDESEWPKPSASGGYTVWAAAALHPELSKTFSREVFNLERKFWRISEPHEFEIKGRMLLNKRALTSPKKLEFVDEILSLCKRYQLSAFAIGMRQFEEQMLEGFSREESRIFRVYHYLLERVEAMMQESYPDDMAIVLLDSSDKETNKRRALAFGNFLYGHEVGKSVQKIVETPFFVSSSLTPGIQIADLFAYALAQQNLERKEPKLKKICDRIRELEWRSNRLDAEHPLRGFRFVDVPDKPARETK
ncbi:MAG: DUF3800 domain-containing protein [Chloroflexi bacterium]|nr:DUF3800 domain-containing protein [Chloroflexota bacterium]MBM3174667.1 DUF3800 domain-containing protein [Chloroflexota bacterium]